MATVRDIAQKANVSIATVSRVLNSKTNVNESTRLLVLHAAQEIGYSIQESAQKKMVSRFIPVLIRQNIVQSSQTRNGGNFFEQAVWAGVETVLTQKKVLTKLQTSEMTVESAEHFAREPGVAGLIILGGVAPNDFLTRLNELNIHFVIVGSHAHPLMLNNVMADVMDGTRQVVRHLIEKGRTKIGFVNGPSTTKTSEAKMDGIRLELEINNLPFETRAVIQSDFFPEAGYQSTQELLKRNLDLNAIIYADDMIAVGGMRSLIEAGLQIPQDIAISGFGNYDISKFTSPPLTTVNYDMHTMGKIAATRLYQLIQDGDSYPWEIRVPASLLIRASA
ncbi:MAG TPA: LacI family DNA-binding transcriptional regulator [Anaerolineales bacterium]|nr:LacI family DNA-binding transcriptional regulator [Anaerolineales bacterium]